MTRTPQELEVAAQHVSYEMVSMVELAMRLHSGFGSNAVLEAMLLHCRSLVDFLGPWRHFPDDIVPSDFITDWDPTVLQVTDDERRAVHKHLAHLTWARVDDGQQEWEYPGLPGATFNAYVRFVEMTEEQRCPGHVLFRGDLQVALMKMGAVNGPGDTRVNYTTTTAELSLVMSSSPQA